MSLRKYELHAVWYPVEIFFLALSLSLSLLVAVKCKPAVIAISYMG